MSFLDTLKRLIGLDDPDVPAIADDPVVETVKVNNFHKAEVPKNDAKPEGGVVLKADPAKVRIIFDKVVEIFNQSLPQYLAQNIDTEKQKEYIYNALDQSIKDYIAQLEVEADARSAARWQKKQDEQRKQLDDLKQKAKDLESKKSEIKEQKLSADRQRRALSDRVQDLQKKVLELEAEKEQLLIENQGLVNKVKVANVHENDLEELKRELDALKSGQQAPKEIIDENRRFANEVKRLKIENKRLEEACEAARVKGTLDSAMFNELQSKASEATKKYKQLEKEHNALAEIAKAKDARILDLENSIAQKDAVIAENDEAFGELETIMQQVEMFEQVKKKLEDRVHKLRDDLKEAKKENETLRTTIKNNLYAHAEQQKAMQDQINSLMSSTGAPDNDFDDAIFDSTSFNAN